MWLQDPRCDEVVQKAWQEGLYKTGGSPFVNCMECCRDRLVSLNKLEFRHVGRKIAELQKKLQILELQSGSNINGEVDEVHRALNSWLDTEVVMWNQRSRNMWLVGGDRNTSFFHAKASNRYQRNLIQGMCDANGIWQEDDRKVESIVVNYFSSIFKTNGPADASIVVDAVHPVVTTDMNLGLIQDFKEGEVVKALKHMHPKKAHGPDGMPPLFYQHYWFLVGNCVTSTILDFLNHCIIPPKF